MSRYTVLDTETTGLDPIKGDRIIEIALIEIVDEKITGNYFHHYINPTIMVNPSAYKVHKLSDSFLSTKVKFKEIIPSLLRFIKRDPIVAHNAYFDRKFLASELLRVGINLCNPFIDTLSISRSLYPNYRNSLLSISQRLKVKTNGPLHGALTDAYILANCFVILKKIITFPLPLLYFNLTIPIALVLKMVLFASKPI